MLLVMQIPPSTGRPGRHSELSDWYRGLLAEHHASGLSLAEFAEVAGVSQQTLVRWRHRLGPGSPVAASEPGIPPSQSADADPVAPHRLVEVRLAGAVPAAAGPAADSEQGVPRFLLRLGGQRAIEVGGGFDANELRRLVAVVEGC